MRRVWLQLLVSAALLLTGASAATPEPAHAAPRTIAAYGDSGVSSNAAGVAALAVDLGSDGYLGLGDYGYSAGPTAWKQQMAALLAGGCLCVRGNHDSNSAYTALYPGGALNWSTRVSGVRLIGIDTERSLWPGSGQWQWLVSALDAAAEPLKILVLHRQWWLGAAASHPGSEFPGDGAAMEGLLAEHGVDLVLAAHEHNYQRSVRGGITYIVAGTGGRGTDVIAGAAPGTVRTYRGRGPLMITLAETGITGRFHAYPGGGQIDSFTILAAAPSVGTVVYDDAPAAGWRNWSWGATVNLSATAPVYAGARSISFTATSAWAGLYLRTATPVPAGSVTLLRFAARATQAGQRYGVELRDESGGRLKSVLIDAYGGAPPASAWKVYQIPVTDLGAAGRAIGGVVIQERNGSAQPALYVDSISFIAADSASSRPVAPPALRTAWLAHPRTRAATRNWS